VKTDLSEELAPLNALAWAIWADVSYHAWHTDEASHEKVKRLSRLQEKLREDIEA